MAISGETAAWPFNTRESVWRATPNTFAASVTFRPSGARQREVAAWERLSGAIDLVIQEA